MCRVSGWLCRLASLTALVLVLGLGLVWRPGDGSGAPTVGPEDRLPLVQVDRSAAAEQLPDFSTIGDIRTRKLAFFTYLLPLVQQQNDHLQRQRHRLEYIRDRLHYADEMSRADLIWVHGVARDFKLETVDIHEALFWQDLLARIDVVPEQLVLVQAANESAWGTSRFARQGNNLFGQWCFKPGCGMVPADRPEGAIYEVARFDSVGEAIAAYMRNLNTSYTYEELREMRARHRATGMEPDPVQLAAGLSRYSERGMDYVADLRTMIRQNRAVMAQARNQLGSGEI